MRSGKVEIGQNEGLQNLMSNSNQCSVAAYLATRLEQLGVGRLFGVAGNYTAPLLDTILENKSSKISISGNPNEICAGFAADAYARLHGIGAVAVTYGVGAMSLINTTAGAHVELAPVVVINGAPTSKEHQNLQHAGLLYSHMTGNEKDDFSMFQRVTVAAERITDASQAPFQIDSALSACISQHRPVYLEVFEDIWRAPCSAPQGRLEAQLVSLVQSELDEAVRATVEMVREYGSPLFWGGVEVQRYRAQESFLELIDQTQFPFTTSALGKSIVSESHPLFRGVYAPSQEDHEMNQFADGAGCLIGLGAWTTGKNTGSRNIAANDVALASHHGVRVGSRYFAGVELQDYIRGLTAHFKSAQLQVQGYQSAGPHVARMMRLKMAAPRAASKAVPIDYDQFFDQLQGWLTEDHIVVVDAGFSGIGAQKLETRAPNGYVAQASWLSIGYSVPAATGVKYAVPNKRPVVIVGDGAFQETCQAVSDHHHSGHDTVVFVLVNGIYGIEQKLVNPNPFRPSPQNYSDKLQNSVYPYNRLNSWSYEKVADVMGGVGRKVTNSIELSEVLREIADTPKSNFVVHVDIPELSIPEAIVQGINEDVGEDETANDAWPPAEVF